MTANSSFNYSYRWPVNNGAPSQLDLVLSNDTPYGAAGDVLDAWCFNANAPILGDRYSDGYQGTTYALESYALKNSGASTLTNLNLNNLGAINWLLNWYPEQAPPDTAPGVVQAAIWTLLGQDWSALQGFAGNPNLGQVYSLVGQALTHLNYVPKAGESIGVLVDPLNGGEHSQPMLIETKAAQLGDRVWHDNNANGVQDAGEAGIAGAKVDLVRDRDGDGQFNSPGEVLNTTTTDANGNYNFAGLTPGVDYQVRFTTPTGFTGASPRQTGEGSADSDGAVSDVVVLDPGEFDKTLDSGYFKHASLGDRVWNDTDRDGVQDAGETGRAGVRVELYTSVNGKPGTLVGTQVTDANGNYKFADLVPGDYVVKFIAPNGLMLSQPNAGDDALDSDAGADGFTGNITLGSGEHNPTIDAGLHSNIGALGDRVWFDTNRNGIQDAGEAGKAKVQLQLITVGADGIAGTSDDRVVATTTTDANGNYLFSNLNAGSYAVKVTGSGINAKTEEITKANTGDDAADSDLTNLLANRISGYTDVVNLAQGEVNLTVDVGVTERLGALGDYVWLDADRDGQQDASERGVEGVQVTLAGAGADGVFGSADDIAANTFTDANGKYLFSDLSAGKYQVTFGTPDGLELTKTNSGSDASDSDANLATGQSQVVTLGAGQTNLTIDAGLVSKDQTNGDELELCEDTSKAFNVLGNDIPGLKLISVKHESASLDNTFKSRGGAISFTDDGNVIYKSMTDYYGVDKLVYVAEDANGQRYTQTVDVQVNAVSDGPVAKGAAYHPSGWERSYVGEDGLRHWVHGVKLSDFGTFNDKADALQTFGTYNKDNNVQSDADGIDTVRVFGLQGVTGANANIVYRGAVLDFSTEGQYYDIPVADINAGLLDIDFSKAYVKYSLAFKVIDSGDIDGACYPGSVISGESDFKLSTPIALDLNGDGKIGVTGETSSYQKDAGAALGRTVQFDIDADGHKDTIEWFDGSGDGILIDNRDGQAAIDMDGERLFGDQGKAFGNGYYKLEQFDANGDGSLAGKELEGIELWIDNGDAVVQDGEIQTLAQHGITEIATTLQMTFDAQGKLHIQSSATRADGTELLSEDVFFAGMDGRALDLADMVGDDASLDGLLGSEGASRAAAPVEAAVDAYADAGDLLRRVMSSASEAAVAA